MPFDPAYLKSYGFSESRQDYSKRDSILYALGLGLGSEPTHPGHLKFVYEKGLCTLPTMAVVLAHPGFWAGIEDLCIDWINMLHVGQGLTLHGELPIEGRVIGRSRVAEVYDRGPGKGALLLYEREVFEDGGQAPIATVRQTLLCRGNGGFAAVAAEVPKPHVMPARPADHVVVQKTLPQMALLYRLSGDMNPLHADPDIAAKAGFAQPILHGLGTFGIAGFALLQSVLGYEAARFKSFDVRFTAPVFPGETIRTELWQDGETISVRSTAVERGKVVLDNGICLISTKIP